MEIASDVQVRIARLIAASPAGHNLLLIGGFRYRFLDRSIRTSKGINYHWSGDLEEKQKELLALLKRRLLPALKRDLGCDGRVDLQGGPEAESPMVKTVTVALWMPGVEHSRIEVPVEVTRVPSLDLPQVRTVAGMIYPTLSDADQVESKIIAVFNRRILQHRDLVDLFLFSGKLTPHSRERLAEKFRSVGVSSSDIIKRLDDLKQYQAHHAKQVQMIIDTQLDPEGASNVNAAGGGRVVLQSVLEILQNHVDTAAGEQ